MKNEEKNAKKKYQKQKIIQEIKRPSIKETTQEEKNNNKNIIQINSKNNIPNIYKLTTGANLFLNSKKTDKNEASNSFEGKMFYEVNNNNTKNIYNLNNPIKTINVYRNNIFNYTNNNILSNLLCDISDDNKNVMVSELDLNISNSQAPTQRSHNNEQQTQKRCLEKQNTEIDFKSQLESNIIKILEKNLISNNENDKNKSDKKRIAQKIRENNNNINNVNNNDNNINDINRINLKQIELKKQNDKKIIQKKIWIILIILIIINIYPK